MRLKVARTEDSVVECLERLRSDGGADVQGPLCRI